MTPEPSPDCVVMETTLSCTAAAIWASEERSTTRVTEELPVCTGVVPPLWSRASAVAAPTPPAPSASSSAAAPVIRMRRPRRGRCGSVPGGVQAGTCGCSAVAYAWPG
jgi:hypothetical protein